MDFMSYVGHLGRAGVQGMSLLYGMAIRGPLRNQQHEDTGSSLFFSHVSLAAAAAIHVVFSLHFLVAGKVFMRDCRSDRGLRSPIFHHFFAQANLVMVAARLAVLAWGLGPLGLGLGLALWAWAWGQARANGAVGQQG